jgi:hypothetical protein
MKSHWHLKNDRKKIFEYLSMLLKLLNLRGMLFFVYFIFSFWSHPIPPNCNDLLSSIFCCNCR